MVNTPLAPIRMMNAKASGTPAKLLVILVKAIIQRRSGPLVRVRLWHARVAMISPRRLEISEISRLRPMA